MDWLSEPMLALYGTIFGGVGLKIAESVLGRAGKKDDTATSLRTELRAELAAVRLEMEKLKREAILADNTSDMWRTRYFSLLAAVATKDEAGIRRHLGH